jgi:hypothetical protein
LESVQIRVQFGFGGAKPNKKLKRVGPSPRTQIAPCPRTQWLHKSPFPVFAGPQIHRHTRKEKRNTPRPETQACRGRSRTLRPAPNSQALQALARRSLTLRLLARRSLALRFLARRSLTLRFLARRSLAKPQIVLPPSACTATCGWLQSFASFASSLLRVNQPAKLSTAAQLPKPPPSQLTPTPPHQPQRAFGPTASLPSRSSLLRVNQPATPSTAAQPPKPPPSQ